jgi:hypothetical protein
MERRERLWTKRENARAFSSSPSSIATWLKASGADDIPLHTGDRWFEQKGEGERERKGETLSGDCFSL